MKGKQSCDSASFPALGKYGVESSLGSLNWSEKQLPFEAFSACRGSCKGPISAMNWSDREVESSQISKASEAPASRVISLVLIL